MNLFKLGVPVLLGCAMAVGAGAQQPVRVDGDDITLTGCVVRSSTTFSSMPEVLVWSRGDMMLAAVETAAGLPTAPVGTSGIAAARVFYWLDDAEDLAKYVGQRVEVKGDLKDFEHGEIEIKRDGEFTEIELELDGEEEKARVPTAWLRAGTPDDAEFNIVAREVDVDDVRALGPCGF